MCGIIGYVGKENAVPIIVSGLKKLEYRGYDSAGIAVCLKSEKNEKDELKNWFKVVKQKGRLSALEKCLQAKPLISSIGIGHTRWATHGEPSDVNSHPHMGSKNKIAVVHNGIIENYRQLKERLLNKGIEFASQTDSEVIAQLAEYYYNGDIMETVVKVASRLEGSYALGIMCLEQPDTLYAIRKDNPLIVGLSEHGNFIASDVPAVLKHTNRVYYMEDEEIAVLNRDTVEFFNIDKEPIQKQIETITWSPDSAEKGGYRHFMLKEIMEQPRVVRDTVQSVLPGLNSENRTVIEKINIGDYDKIVVTACGSAYNAGIVGKHVLEKMCRIPIEVDLASEFRYKSPLVDSRTLVVLISQSGETADTIAALREAKSLGAATLSIVNVVGSTIAKEADFTLYTSAGPEIAVATTKAFTAQLILLYVLSAEFAVQSGRLSGEEHRWLFDEMLTLPDKITQILEQTDDIQKYASECVGYKSIFFIGRNIDYSIVPEGSLKLKEISYVHSEAYAGGELKHGPISLITEDALVVALSNSERLFGKIMSNVEQVISRGAKVLLIGNCPYEDDSGPVCAKISHIDIPQTLEYFSPSLSVIVLQLFSYYVAANKGLDIDKPRNLAKSVTVE
ncbi:MAG: glutamine--fructose-6-phosphate transaminase (isomerizing) [Oscillospiraceae bacterium]|nr:glutamine--fructose-6-phosphate transaminase (isomerizing) [Oscillospiraceae bacterium]